MKPEKLNNLILIGDRVLIKAKSANSKTKGGLVLPPGYSEKEEVQSGYVIKTGPGYPIPLPRESDIEPWKAKDDSPTYIPLQAKEGDMALFLQKGAIEVEIDGEKYFIVSHQSILLLERDEELFT
ncbi:MAG TPA: chaperonin [Bacteroidales bacterium]|nr:chaperonin [Bacteroidales bacterium]